MSDIFRNSADDANEEGADSDAEYDEHGQLMPRSTEQGSVWKTVTTANEDEEEEEDDAVETDKPVPAPAAGMSQYMTGTSIQRLVTVLYSS